MTYSSVLTGEHVVHTYNSPSRGWQLSLTGWLYWSLLWVTFAAMAGNCHRVSTILRWVLVTKFTLHSLSLSLLSLRVWALYPSRPRLTLTARDIPAPAVRASSARACRGRGNFYGQKAGDSSSLGSAGHGTPVTELRPAEILSTRASSCGSCHSWHHTSCQLPCASHVGGDYSDSDR